MIREVGDEYALTLTSVQFELVRRSIIISCGDRYPPVVISVVVGEVQERLLKLRDIRVDVNSLEKLDVMLTLGELRSLWTIVALMYMDSSSSEETFYNRVGFYRENVQRVGKGLLRAIEGVENVDGG